MSRRRDALDYHAEGRPGKVAIRPTKPLQTQRDLSLAYTPGVAEPCLEIAEHPERVFDYTARGNLVAVVSNGTAVLGLGDIGPAASKPVMEGKGVLFKRFADIDVFDIEIDARDPDQVIDVVAALEPTFGGINLEDIKAPECFYIEEKLRERMQIPVFHDDQHGTAIIAAAAFVNALEIVEKKAEDVRCVFSGAGAAALACAHLFIAVGVRPENLILCDSRGVIHTGREKGMNPYKARLAVDTSLRTLEEAMKDADVFVGVSAKGVVSKDMVRSMARDPIVMAMANPDPEISYPDAVDAREDIVMATGRSDYPNQVNNVLGFPFIFRGALDVRATGINEEMKLAAVHALAELAKDEVPEDVKQAYGAANLRFGREYIIPKPFDWRALLRVAPAVAKAAMDSGVARRPIEDFDAYRARLEVILGREREVMRAVIRKAARTPKRVVFPEGDSLKILRAAQLCVEEGIARPIVLGEPDVIEALAAEHEIALEGVRIIDNLHDPHVAPYEEAYWQRRRRRGVTRNEAARIIRRRNHFGSMMVELGDADAMVSGMTRSYPDTVRPPLEVIGPRPGVRRVAGAHLVILSDRVKIFADTTVNVDPTAEDLAEIAIATAAMARRLDIEPHIAMLSFSNFGSNAAPQARKVKRAVEILRERAPDLDVDGEMQVDPAIDVAKRERLFEFCTLKAEANVLIFPELNSANIAYKLMKGLGDAEVVGPILIGMNRPVNVLERDCSVRSVLNMVAISVVQAQEMAPPVGAGQEGQG
ncbi:MAG: NADP-dependent malic enzyme [Myxococcales bacterium]|nr:NADP-dependent malic enzyme [Myxococcales bacterium]